MNSFWSFSEKFLSKFSYHIIKFMYFLTYNYTSQSLILLYYIFYQNEPSAQTISYKYLGGKVHFMKFIRLLTLSPYLLKMKPKPDSTVNIWVFQYFHKIEYPYFLLLSRCSLPSSSPTNKLPISFS